MKYTDTQKHLEGIMLSKMSQKEKTKENSKRVMAKNNWKKGQENWSLIGSLL